MKAQYKPHTYRLKGKFCTAKQWALAKIQALRTRITELCEAFKRKISKDTRCLVITAICKLNAKIRELKSVYNLDYLD